MPFNENNIKVYNNIGKAIKLLRESKNLTQEYMAYKLGYNDRGAYAKIERGEYNTLDILLLLNICKLLNCNLVHLMLMADVVIIELPIKTYSEFLDSLKYENWNENEKEGEE
jgi:transcriptional regulator with XRE-family HTH domain